MLTLNIVQGFANLGLGVPQMYTSTNQTTGDVMSVLMELVPLLPMLALGSSKQARDLAAPSPFHGILMDMEHQSRSLKHPTGKPHLRFFNLNMPGQLANTLPCTGISVIWTVPALGWLELLS